MRSVARRRIDTIKKTDKVMTHRLDFYELFMCAWGGVGARRKIKTGIIIVLRVYMRNWGIRRGIYASRRADVAVCAMTAKKVYNIIEFMSVVALRLMDNRIEIKIRNLF